MGNTVGNGGVGGEMAGVGGGGLWGRCVSWFWGHGGKGGSGYQSECTPAKINPTMTDCEDSEDTIFIWVKKDVDGPAFIDYAERAGKIKTDRETGFRMALMRKTDTGEHTKEGIVTYEQKHDVKNALKILEELQSKGQVIKVLSAGDYLKEKDITDCYCPKKEGANTAWCLWRWQTFKHQSRGGKGGKGGSGWFGWSRGQDGESGGCGPGGQGGQGGKGGGLL